MSIILLARELGSDKRAELRPVEDKKRCKDQVLIGIVSTTDEK